MLLTDVNNLMNQMEKEFPEVISISSIGSTWEHRDISVITLDATKFVNSEAFKSIPLPEKKVVVQKAVET